MKVYDKHKDIKEKLSKADVVVDSPCMLTCGKRAQGYGTPTYTYGKRV